MKDLHSKIDTLQKQQFGEINELHSRRTAELLLEMTKKFGDEVLEVASHMPMDYKGLMQWHLKRTANLMKELQQRFGDEVYEVLLEKERKDRLQNGSEIARQSGSNTLQDIVPYFGGEQNVIEKTEQECIMKTPYCMLAEAAKAEGITEFIYQLHCCNDPCFVEGFNPLLGCEVRKSLLHGDDCCEHRIYVKESYEKKEWNP